MKSMVKKLKQNLRSGSSGKRKEKDIQEERWFLENGSIFLKELIADCNGKSIPIRSFSCSQILEATNNFDSSCFVSEDGFGWYKWYKGIIEDKSYLFKRFTGQHTEGEAYNDSVLAARMSNHSNFLKLFGSCFEFRFPVFVFENAEHGALTRRGRIVVNGEDSLLPWSVRLKIAKEIANAVTYLHTAFPKIIIHRIIKTTNIFLDKNWTARLTDFSLAVTLPEGESRIEVSVTGTVGYCDPWYMVTGFLTEYSDVYSFGICLFVFLTGRLAYEYVRSDGEYKGIVSYVKDFYENGKLDEVIDPMMLKEITSGQRLQVEACVVLALICCEEKYEDRPKMIQVAKELKRIETSLKDPST